MSNEDNNKQEDKSIIKNKGGRPSKKIKYASEQKEILNRLFIILGIIDRNKVFYLDDIEAEAKKQQDILNLIPDVKKYFNCGTWTCFTNKEMPNQYISLVKYILKDMNIKTASISMMNEKNKNLKKRGIQIME